MAAPPQTHPQDPAMDDLLEGVPEKTILLALKMAQLMEGKSEEDRQAVLKSFTNSPSGQTRTNTTDSQQSQSESGHTNNDFQEIPENGIVDSESTGSIGNNGSLQKDLNTAITMETTSKITESQVKPNGPLVVDDGKMEEQGTGMPGKSTDVQSEKDSILSSSPDKHEEINHDQFFSCDEHQKMSVAIESSKNDMDDNEHLRNAATVYIQPNEIDDTESQPKSTDHQEGINKMDDSEKDLTPVYRMESSEDELPPSTPASGRQSPAGSELSESPLEEKMHLTKPFGTTKDLTEPLKGLMISNSSITVEPETHQARYKAVSHSLPAVNLNSSPTLTKPEFQKSNLNYKRTPISGLPKAFGLSGVKPALSGTHIGGQDQNLPAFPSGQKEPTFSSSQDSKPVQEDAFGGTSSGHKTHEKAKPEERVTVTSSVTPLRNISTLSPGQDMTTSPLSLPSLPSIPIFYQPHVVIQDNLPVLMLRPVLAPNRSHELQDTVPLGATPLMFPLTGGQPVESRIMMNSCDATTEAETDSRYLMQKSERGVLKTQPPPKEAYSSESDMEERALHEKHGEQDTQPISSGDSRVSGFEEKTCRTVQPRNPFLVNNRTATTYTLTTSSLPNDNYGYPVTSTQKVVPSISSNPFVPEEPIRTCPGDYFSRTDFKTIPKSMLAGQVQPREPPVSQISSHATQPTGPSLSQIGPSGKSTTGLPVSHIGASAVAPWGLTSDNTMPPREPSVGQVNTTLPKGLPVGQAHGNTTLPRQHMPSDSMLSLLVTKDQAEIQANEGEMNFNPAPVRLDPTVTPLRCNFSAVASSVASNNSSIANNGFTVSGTGFTAGNTQAESQPEQAPKTMKTPLPGHIAPYWIPDDEVFNCAYCHLKFTIIRRKHHCRGCGKIFCSDCCSQLARLSYLQYQIGRICILCTNAIQQAIKKRKKNVRSQSRQEALSNNSTHVTKGNQTATSPAVTATSHNQPPLSTSVLSSMESCPQRIVHPVAASSKPSPNIFEPTVLNPNSLANPDRSLHPQTNMPNQSQLVYVPRNFSTEIARYSDPTPGQTKDTSLVHQSSGAFNGQPVFSNGWQASESFPQNNPAQRTYQGSYNSSTTQSFKVAPNMSVAMANPQDMTSFSQSDKSAFHTPQRQVTNQNFSSQQKQTHPSLDSRQRNTSFTEMKIPLRPAGRVVSWKGESFAIRLLGQDKRKALARDLRDLPHGVTMQIADGLQVIIKKIKVQKNPAIQAWCCFSNGLKSFNQPEIVMLFKVIPKEDVVPEEILRMYKVILDLVKLGNTFQHSNFLAFNSPFLGTSDNAGFVFTKDSLTTQIKAVGEEKCDFLYAILVKRSELEYTKYTPTRFLVRLGQETKSFPYPVINSRDRPVVYDGVDGDDVIYNTSLALNNYLKNSIPEALIPGLIVLQEDSKVVLQLPSEAQQMIVNLFDRLMFKANQTATIPLVSDLSTNVDQFKVYHQSINTQEVALPKHVALFRNPNNPSHCGISSVTGLGFIILHLGASDSPTLQQRGRLLDDGVIVHLTDIHTNKVRESLYRRSNCNFYLGDQDKVLYFELRWIQEPIVTPVTQPSPMTQEPQAESYPGSATIDVRHSGNSSEKKKLANARLGDVLIIIRQFEQSIKQACMESLMMHANKMRAGETKELILRLSLRDGYKQWSIGPSNQPMGLIRSLQMALHAVKLPHLHNSCLGLSFDVTIIKEY